MCMKWCEKVSNTDVSKTCQKCINLLSNFDRFKVHQVQAGYVRITFMLYVTGEREREREIIFNG